jgi:hypothetical protein
MRPSRPTRRRCAHEGDGDELAQHSARGRAVTGRALLRLIGAQVCLHATMAGLRLAAPLLALQQGYSPAAVGVLIALFALTQVFLALPAAALPTGTASSGHWPGPSGPPPQARRWPWPFPRSRCCAWRPC